MAVPSVEKESSSITMVVDKWAHKQVDQFSPIHRIDGYPWRLRFRRGSNKLYVVCDKSSEAELWECTATFSSPNTRKSPVTRMFNSWDNTSQEQILYWFPNANENTLTINVAIKDEGYSWRIRPILGPFDKVLVIGKEEKKIPVNSEALASQSIFFDRLFNGDFKEKNMDEIFIGDVEYEEFFNMIEMVYGSDGPSLTDENVYKFLELADRFDVKIVEDRIVSYLLSTSSPFSILISDQFNIPFLKDNLLKRFTTAQMTDLINSTEFDQLSHEFLQDLLSKDSINAFQRYLDRRTSQIPVSYTLPATNRFHKISMVVNDFDKDGAQYNEQFSSVCRINGFPWRIRIQKVRALCDGYFVCNLYVVCDKWNEADLWKCTATISSSFGRCGPKLFACWDRSHEQIVCKDRTIRVGSVVEVYIATNDDGEIYRRRPSLDPLEPRDGVLVFKNFWKMEKKMEVNKKSLAAQSPFFDRLFFGNFKEKDMKEIPIEGVGYEEFATIMTLLYEHERLYVIDNKSLNCDNVERMLQLADRFELKILKDRIVFILLSNFSHHISLAKKLLISEQFDHPLLKEGIISQFNSIKKLKELSESPEWKKLPKETIRILFKKFCV